jgi:phenylacetate-CoA ligase
MIAFDPELTDAQRHPLLTDAGRALLRWLHEHEAAPRFNHRCGDRLTAEGLVRVRLFAEQVAAATSANPSPVALSGSAGHGAVRQNASEVSRPDASAHMTGLSMTAEALPPWLLPFAAECYRDVPFYRSRGRLPDAFAAIPTCDRAALSREPWRFVPDAQPLDDLIVYTTSGATTGHRLEVLSHPEVAAMYLPLLEAALATRGVRLAGGAGRVSIVLACWQRRTYTYATVLAYLGGAGYAKINLNPADWRDPADRARYLDACAPELYTGDPLAFAALAELPLTTRPKALISTAMALLPGLQAQLETRFGCPALDLYSLNEAGPVAVGIAADVTGHSERVNGTMSVTAEHQRRVSPSHGDSSLDTRRYESPGADPLRMTEAKVFHLLQPRLHVEVLDAAGQPCPPGVRGEITLTGGFNPFLPLLRYRTGDHAALDYLDGRPVLVGLEGRPPVVFRGRAGQPINNVDVSAALRPFALAQFQLHQAEDGALTLRVRDLTPRPPLPSTSSGQALPGKGGSGGPLPCREGFFGGVRAALLALFGADQPLTIELVEAFDGAGDKVVAYTRTLTARQSFHSAPIFDPDADDADYADDAEIDRGISVSSASQRSLHDPT